MQIMTKIDIITRPGKLEELKEALNAIGVTGMTVSQVFGCGLQKGHTEIYRGKEYNINLLAGIKIEIVVCEVPVDNVVSVVKKVCRTGKIGDGKIFIYPIENAVRIRTGEEGPIAILDPKDII
jgi:nitrogen regulatory protein P-II 1